VAACGRSERPIGNARTAATNGRSAAIGTPNRAILSD
jgi:hypothetical protein